jgi:hypothetical protein
MLGLGLHPSAFCTCGQSDSRFVETANPFIFLYKLFILLHPRGQPTALEEDKTLLYVVQYACGVKISLFQRSVTVPVCYTDRWDYT